MEEEKTLFKNIDSLRTSFYKLLSTKHDIKLKTHYSREKFKSRDEFISQEGNLVIHVPCGYIKKGLQFYVKNIKDSESRYLNVGMLFRFQLTSKYINENLFNDSIIKDMLDNNANESDFFYMIDFIFDEYLKWCERYGEESKKTYLMKDKCNNYYKIGVSKNPKYREKTLQSEKPTIEMVKVWDKNIESHLHDKYKRQRIRGEWFNLTPIQVKYICTHY